MQNPPDIWTEQLRLVAIKPQSLRVGSAALGELTKAALPASWPPEHWEPHVFDLLEKQYLAAPFTLAWNRYIVHRGELPTLIGTIGAFAKSQGKAEIGYSVLEPWQRRGLATESLRALLPVIFNCESVQTILAHTYPQLIASIRVLEKCGFHLVGAGEEEGTVSYELDRSEFAKDLF